MLEIFINEQLIDLSKGFSSIPLILKSAFLTNQSAFSFPFNIPNNLQNREVLNIQSNENNYVKLGNINARIRYNTFTIDGNVKITHIGDNIELNFTGYESLIFKRMNAAKLTDIPESVVFTANDLFNSSQSSNNIFTCCPVNVSTKSNLSVNALGPDWDTYILNYNDDTRINQTALQSAIPPGNPAENYNNLNSTHVAPFLYLKYVIEKIFDYLGINIEENIIEDDTDWQELIVLYMPQTFFNRGQVGGTMYFSEVLPSITINEFISELEDRLLIKFVLNPFKRSVKIISSIDIILSTSKTNITDRVSEILDSGMITSDNYYLRQDLISSDEFMNKDDFPDFIDIDSSNTNDIDIKVKSTSSLSPLLENIYIKQAPGVNIDWFYRSVEIAKIGYNINESSETVTPWPELPWRLMFVDFPTESERFKIDSVTGVKTVLTSQTFAVGRYKLTKSLKWEDSGNGIYDLFYKDIIFWRNNLAKPIILTARFESDDLVDFDFLKKYHAGSMDFLIEEIPVELFLNKIKIGNIKAVTT